MQTEIVAANWAEHEPLLARMQQTIIFQTVSTIERENKLKWHHGIHYSIQFIYNKCLLVYTFIYLRNKSENSGNKAEE